MTESLERIEELIRSTGLRQICIEQSGDSCHWLGGSDDINFRIVGLPRAAVEAIVEIVNTAPEILSALKERRDEKRQGAWAAGPAQFVHPE